MAKQLRGDSIALTEGLLIAGWWLLGDGLALSGASRQGRVAAPSVCFAVACILLAAAPTASPCFRRWRRSSPLPPEGEPCGTPCPLYKYTENPIGKGRSAGKTQKNRFSSCQTGQNALFYSHSLTI